MPPLKRPVGSLAFWFLAAAMALPVAARVLAEATTKPSPIQATIEKIAADFRKAVDAANDRYAKQARPLDKRRASAIEQAGRSAIARLKRAGQDAKRMGSEVGESLARAQAEKVTQAVQAACAAQPAGSWKVAFGGHNYVAILAPMTWPEARKACRQMGGHLATLETKEETEFLKKLISGIGCWVGCTDRPQEGRWRWLNGTPVDRSLWAQGEPDNAWGGQDFGMLNARGLGDAGHKGSKGAGFICEWE